MPQVDMGPLTCVRRFRPASQDSQRQLELQAASTPAWQQNRRSEENLLVVSKQSVIERKDLPRKTYLVRKTYSCGGNYLGFSDSRDVDES